MKIVLFAPGAEDARSPAWGHMVMSLRALGHEVIPVDAGDLERLVVRKSPEDQWRWVLDTYRPEVVVLVPDDQPTDQSIMAEVTLRSIRLVLLDIAEVSGWVPADATRILAAVHSPTLTNGTEPEAVRRTHDIVAFADHSPERASLVVELVEAGVDVGVYGDGWRDTPQLRALTYGPIPYASIGPVLRTAKVALVLPEVSRPASSIGARQAALDAAATGVPVIALQAPFVGDVVHCHEARDVAEVTALLNEDLTPATAIGAYEWESLWQGLLGPPPSFRLAVRKEGPKVSFVTATYNLEQYVGPAIESLLEQTVQDFEILVVNDGSSDNSTAVVQKYLSDSRVKLIEQTNIGQTGRIDWVFRRSTAIARGEYVAMLGGDDIAFRDRTERQLEVLEEDRGADVVHTGGIAIDENGEGSQKLWAIENSYDTANLLRRHVLSNAIASPTFMARRSFFEEAGSWTSGFACDYHFWMMAARTMRCRFLPEPTTYYRMHATNSSLGAGASNASKQGLLVRAAHADRSTIADLYPSLQWHQDDDQAWTAAYVDLASRFMLHMPDPDKALALLEYVYATFEEVPDDVRYNEALAYRLKQDVSGAQKALDRMRTAGPLKAEQVTLEHHFDAHMISTKPFDLPAELARVTRVWDGTLASRRRFLLIPDWQEPERMTDFVAAYLESYVATDDVDLVIPTLGLPPQDALQRLPRALPRDIDLTTSAIVTLERWDDLDFLPADRFSAIGNLLVGADSASWRQQLEAARPSVLPVDP